jgi:hypothetical protein
MLQIHLSSRFCQPPRPRTCDLFENIQIIVDGTECPIQRPTDDDIQWLFYSGKKKKHTLKYEVAVNITNGEIVWISGPAPGKTHDLTMLRNNGLLLLLLSGEWLLADKGYQGDSRILVPFKGKWEDLTPWQQTFNRIVGSVRVLVERSIGRIKRFSCLKVPWRHDISLHMIAFTVCAQLAQIGIVVNALEKQINPWL